MQLARSSWLATHKVQCSNCRHPHPQRTLVSIMSMQAHAVWASCERNSVAAECTAVVAESCMLAAMRPKQQHPCS